MKGFSNHLLPKLFIGIGTSISLVNWAYPAKAQIDILGAEASNCSNLVKYLNQNPSQLMNYATQVHQCSQILQEYKQREDQRNDVIGEQGDCLVKRALEGGTDKAQCLTNPYETPQNPNYPNNY